MRSTNGTLIDGTALVPGIARPLEPGARLKIGDVELVVRYD